MIGRASIGNPWIFRDIKTYFDFKNGISSLEKTEQPSIAERVDVCRTHLVKSIEWKGDRAGIFEMRKHYSNYFKGMDHFRESRMRLVTANTFDEINSVLEEILFERQTKNFVQQTSARTELLAAV